MPSEPAYSSRLGSLPLLALLLAGCAGRHPGAEATDVAMRASNGPVVGERLLARAARVSEQDEAWVALGLVERAVALRERRLGREHPDTLDAIGELADVYASLGAVADAEALYREALAASELAAGEEASRTAAHQDRFGSFLSQQGRHEEAAMLLQRALAIRERTLGPNDPATVDSVESLARALQWAGQYADAEPLQLRAVASHERHDGPEAEPTLWARLALAWLYGSVDRYPEADALFRRTLEVAQRTLGDDHALTLASTQGLGGVLQVLGRSDEAETLLYGAWDRAQLELGFDHPTTLGLTWTLASLRESQGRLADAEPLYGFILQSREMFLGSEHPDTLDTLAAIAHVQATPGRYTEAETTFLRALEAQQRLLGGEHPGTLRTLADLTRMYQAQGRLTDAVAAARRLSAGEEAYLARNLEGSEMARQAFFDSFQRSTALVMSLYVQNPIEDAEARALAAETWLRRKGRVLEAQTDTFAVLRRGLDPEGLTLLEQLRSLRRQEAALYRSSTAPVPADLADRLTALEQGISEVERQLSLKSRSYASAKAPVTLESVRAALPPGGVLLQYAVQTAGPDGGGEQLVAFVLRSDGQLTGYRLGALQELTARIEGFRQMRSDVLARWLYVRLVAPVLPDPGSASHLFISPDGPLNLLPFEALLGAGDVPLLETVLVSYLDNGRDLLRIRARAQLPSGPPIILANPAFGEGSWAPLPATAAEASSLAARFPDARVYTEEQAALSVLRDARGPRILHIATHGFYLPNDPRTLLDENPMRRAGLLLAGANDPTRGDTRLVASEAATMDLEGTELAVLSACETGLGDARSGEGVYGMRRALALAGAQSQVVSLWKVGDAATAAFMDAFYARIAVGTPRAEAMREARRALRADPRFTARMEWAAFVLSGDWR